jgi:hypothetical protein
LAVGPVFVERNHGIPHEDRGIMLAEETGQINAPAFEVDR